MRPEPSTRPEVNAPGPTLPPPSGRGSPAWRAVLERAALREILMGAQDNLTNVLAVVLGVAIGAGRSDLVALAGSAAAIAEAISMGGVLYTSSRAERGPRFDTRGPGPLPDTAAPRLSPALSGWTTFTAALLAGLVPLAPFWVLPFAAATVISVLASIAVLFALGAVTGRISGNIWWQDGLRLLTVAGLAAVAAAVVGATLRVG
jgi:VIT1/CCC1 family predicted Fe2+/Mn2+ transporter